MQKLSERGKFFTERVSKNSVDVQIVTLTGIVRGQLSIMPGQRVKDHLNNGGEQFLAVTGASVMDRDGHNLQELEFVALNKRHIVSVTPLGNEHVSSDEDGYISN
jgi:hypothetical protein